MVVVATLEILGGLLGKSDCVNARCVDEPRRLTVRLARKQAEQVSETVLAAYEVRDVSEVVTRPADPKTTDSARSKIDVMPRAVDPESEPSSIADVYSMARQSVTRRVDDRFAKEQIRKSMWRSTGSMMFEDTGEFDFREPETVIADREFRVPLGVLGIGLTIGGCFFGIPLAGIPVEERTVGPNVIYCRDIYE